jgi:glycosyltransferase involved in cell wall biosynthesis
VKVDLVSYLDPRQATGGGELALRTQIAEGLARGHEIRHAHMLPRAVFDCHARPDVTVLADVWNVPGHWGRFDRRLRAKLLPRAAARRYRARVDAAVVSRRFVHYDNAYVDLCLHAYLPCNGHMRGSLCVLGDRSCEAFRAQTRRLYADSLSNVFVSPLHARTVSGMVGAATAPDVIVRPLIETARFRNENRLREFPLLYVGPLTEAKGLHAMVAHPRAAEILAVGGGRRSAKWPGRLLPTVPYERMPDIYNRSRRLVFLPRWPEPQGRTVIEAALSGCELEVNDRVGAMSFSRSPGDPLLSSASASEWWDALEVLARKGTSPG